MEEVKTQVKYVSLDELLKLDVSDTCSYIKKLAPKIYDIYETIRIKSNRCK